MLQPVWEAYNASFIIKFYSSAFSLIYKAFKLEHLPTGKQCMIGRLIPLQGFVFFSFISSKQIIKCILRRLSFEENKINLFHNG